MDELKEKTSERLQTLLKSRKMKAAELARISYVSADTISKVIRKKELLSIKNALLIARALGVSLDYLYGNSDVENTEQYALDIMNKHISSFVRKSVFGGSALNKSISFSAAYFNYLDGVCEAKKADIKEELRQIWLKEIETDFLNTIKDDTTQGVEYALIKQELLTKEVLDQLEKAKREMDG